MAINRAVSLCSTTPAKRIKLSSTQYSSLTAEISNWSDLFPELFQLLLSKLSFVNIIRFKAVCSSWRRAVESYISSTTYSPFSQAPWLMLPAQEYDPDTSNVCDSRCFYSLQDKKEYALNMKQLLSYGDWCIGSSHGWLILLGWDDDQVCKPFLFNPFSKARIELPDFLRFQDDEELQRTQFSKAILTSDPSHDRHYGVIVQVMQDFGTSKLFFYKKENSCWSSVNAGETKGYSDIISCNDQLYGLTLDCSIDIWDFYGSLPIKKRKIRTSTSRKLVEAMKTYRGLYSSQSYLVDSRGDLLLVVRFIGNFVNHKGEVVDESHLLGDEDTHPRICPYQTKMFQVYKFNSSDKKWVDVESLNDQVLFLGGNHSMSISAQDFSGCEKNSIYFTDDNWDQINEDYLYGGHDLGRFSLDEKIVKQFNWHNAGRIDPAPFWIFPNP